MATTAELLEKLNRVSPQDQEESLLERLNRLSPLPSQDQIQPAAEPEGFFRSPAEILAQARGMLGAAQTIGAGALGEVVGGITGAVTAAIPGTVPGAGVGVLERVREEIAVEPTTPEAIANIEALGRTFEPVAELLKTAEQISGDIGFDIAGPIGGAIGATLPTAAAEALGLGVGGRVVTAAARAAPGAAVEAATGVARQVFQFQTPTKQRIAELIESGSTDVETAGFKLIDEINKGKPRVEKDKVALETIKQGFDEGVIAAIKGSSSTDKVKMSKMVRIMQRGKKNKRFAVTNRPTDVAGDSLLDRFRVVRKVNRDAGKRLDGVANTLRGRQVDSNNAVNSFINDLDSIGVSIGNDLKPNFKGSTIEGLTGPEAAINRVVKRMVDVADAPDAFELHRLKKFIDEQVTFGKTAEGLAGRTETILKNLRRNLDQTLDSNFPEYDRINTRFSETREAIDALQDVAGRKLDLTGKRADKATGTLLRRLMSNAQSRVNLLDSVEQIEGVAKKFGGKFDDDLLTQVLFADELDAVFGPVARTSLQGQIAQAISDIPTTEVGLVTRVAKAGFERFKGVNEEAAFKSIRKLLER